MYILPSVMPRHSAKLLFAECLRLGARQRLTPLIACCSFAECLPLPSAQHSAKYSLPSVFLCLALGKGRVHHVFFLCRVQHSAKRLFAECPIFCTRQSLGHSAKAAFPVVIIGRGSNRSRRDASPNHQCRCYMTYILTYLINNTNNHRRRCYSMSDACYWYHL
jgi:hypothetical protein